MRNDEKKQLELHVAKDEAQESAKEHVVFDFSGTEYANVEDIALILTARLQSAPTDDVWVRSISGRTAQILKYLRLEHLFRRYPEGDGQMN